MESRLRGFALSWFFAPYVGSADIDFFKRIKDTALDYTVVQVKRGLRDDSVLRFATRARIERIEVATSDHRQPRTRKVRDEYLAGALREFAKAPDGYDFLISHSNEVPSHAAAYELKRRHPRLPWIAYFGDVIAANPYVRHIGDYPLKEEDEETEALALRHADVVIVNNAYQRELMFAGSLREHAAKAVIIPHCFDPAMYPQEPPAPNPRFTFMHLGTLYHVKRTAAPLLRGVDRLLEVYPKYRDRFEVVFYGGAPCADDAAVHFHMRNRMQVRFEDPIPYLESLRRMREADALVLIDGLFTEADDGLTVNPFFAGKLADYVGAQRPILGITMPRGPTAEILAEAGYLAADERPDRIAYVLKRYLDGKVPLRAPTSFRRFECTEVAALMEQAIRAAVRRTPRAGQSSAA